MNKPDFPIEELEFHSAWSSTAGQRVAYQHAVKFLRETAGNFYVAGRDELASAFRRSADELATYEKEASENLDAYIKEGNRRRKGGSQ